jgi:hypothetical protein
LVVAAAVAFVALREERPAGTGAGTSNRVPAARATQGDVPIVDVKIELLKDKRAELAEAERNPFRFQPRPAPPPPRTAAPSVRPAPIAPPAPSGPPPPPPIALRFIGLMDAPTQGGRVAIMSDGRGNVFYGKEGDIIEGRYKLLKISPEAAELSYADGRGRQTIRLSGQ